MNPSDRYICAACGTAISTSGGRCPMCGALQPESPRPAPVPEEEAPAPPRAASSQRVVALVGGGALVLLVAAGLAWKIASASGKPVPTAAVSSAAPPPSASATPRPAGMDAAEALLESTKLAQGWNADARLVSFVADQVVGGRVDTAHGGRIEIVFAEPGSGGLLPGTAVGDARFVVVFDAKGRHTSRRKRGPRALGVAPPDCPLDVAWRSVVASGIPSSKPLGMRYAMDPERQRAVWTATTRDRPGQTRTLDGRNCAVLLR